MHNNKKQKTIAPLLSLSRCRRCCRCRDADAVITIALSAHQIGVLGASSLPAGCVVPQLTLQHRKVALPPPPVVQRVSRPHVDVMVELLREVFCLHLINDGAGWLRVGSDVDDSGRCF